VRCNERIDSATILAILAGISVNDVIAIFPKLLDSVVPS